MSTLSFLAPLLLFAIGAAALAALAIITAYVETVSARIPTR